MRQKIHQSSAATQTICSDYFARCGVLCFLVFTNFSSVNPQHTSAECLPTQNYPPSIRVYGLLKPLKKINLYHHDEEGLRRTLSQCEVSDEKKETFILIFHASISQFLITKRALTKAYPELPTHAYPLIHHPPSPQILLSDSPKEWNAISHSKPCFFQIHFPPQPLLQLLLSIRHASIHPCIVLGSKIAIK